MDKRGGEQTPPLPGKHIAAEIRAPVHQVLDTVGLVGETPRSTMARYTAQLMPTRV